MTDKLIISGSRSINNQEFILESIYKSSLYTGEEEILVGDAKGVDKIVRLYFDNVTLYQAEWGKYGDSAGPMRNGEMVEDGDKLIAIWDGESTGTANAIGQAKDQGLPVDIIHCEENSLFDY